MAVEFKLPELGENITSGTIVSLQVKEGETIANDQVIMELETDKAVIEVPADSSGTITKIHVKEGDEVKVGQTVLTIDAAAQQTKEESKPAESKVEKEEAPVKKETEKPKSKKSAGVVDFKVPELGENIESGTVAGILVAVGDSITKDQGLFELETDKAVAEVPSELDGVVKEILIKEGDQVKVGQVVLKISAETVEESPGEEPSAPEPAEKAQEATRPAAAPRKETEAPVTQASDQEFRKPRPAVELVPAAPSVRRFAREIGIDISAVPGSGPGGRISIEDVKRYSKSLNTQQKASQSVFQGFEAEALPDFSKWGEIETKPMNKVRETTAKHLSYAWATIPHVTQHDKADITVLEKLRKQFASKAEQAGGKLTVTAILLKVIEKALKIFPQFNASVDMANKTIIYKKYYHIGVAVDTERGLLVPVVRDVDKKNIIRLSVELSELSQKARNRKLSLEEMQGGNFSISNLGGIGGTAFTPVVHSPEVAILGVSRAAMEPVYMDGEFQPRLMMPLSLSYDHRLIDGADAARFLRWVCEALEQPILMSLEG
jgi:pyruvate dehydrogenase E2 component (dihydrolipoamide acetyltransferase)